MTTKTPVRLQHTLPGEAVASAIEAASRHAEKTVYASGEAKMVTIGHLANILLQSVYGFESHEGSLVDDEDL